MKKKTGFKGIKNKILFWFLVIALLPLILNTIIIYQQRSKSIKEESFNKLKAIRDLKVGEINNWLEERIGDVTIISQDFEIRDLENALKNTVKTEQDVKAVSNAQKLMKRYLKNYNQYSEIFIINSFSGKVDISTDETQIGKDKSNDTYFINPMNSGKIYIKDVHYSEHIQKLSMTFSIPIYCLTHSTHKTGVLVARVDLENTLYNLLLDNTGLGKTGETLITNKNGIALNELKWQKNAPLNLKIKAKPVLLASQGKTGITETVDYRGEKILAAFTYIPSTQWGFIAKQDLKEVYSPIHQMTRQMVVTILLSLVMVYLLAVVLAKNITQPLLKIINTSKKIEKGDLSARNIDIGGDEIGYLAKSINIMADSLTNQMVIQNNVAKITDTMVNAENLKDFGIKLIKKLIDITKSDLCSFYILNHDKNIFEYSTSIGINSELLEPFDASIFEGEFGRALATKKISQIKDIPEDTSFKFKTFAGTILPKEIITIPVMVKEKVCAVISLANFNQYSKEDLNTIQQSWQGMNTVFSNLLSTAKIRNLAVDLESNNQELQAQSEELQQQSDELQEQNMELGVQKQQVNEANRLKSEFLSNMSHELRTPLNSVMALSRVLVMQAKEKLSKEETHYLEIIERNGKKLLNLINDILDLSKIETGRMDVSPKFFSPKTTIESIVEILEPLADNQCTRIIQNISDNLPLIESDESRTHQIFQNIIGNAVKFTKKGKVIVTASSNEQAILVDIIDTGIGIPENELPHIFDEFRQVDGSSARLFEGTGLGLAIAFKAARMLGGDIIVKSTLNQGTKFTVTLPIKWEGIIQGSEPVILSSPVQINPRQKTILIVDDEPDVIKMIADYLTQEGYNIITATSGKEAIKLAETYQPFAVTLDVLMPEMDGWEVLQKLKQNNKTAGIPVIIVSVSDNRQTGLALGAVGYISKPVNKKVLISEIFKIGGENASSVLVVDDNNIDLKMATQIIENEGIQTIAANDGYKCIELLKETVPDVLVLDLVMPQMDGFEVLEKIRNQPETSTLPVIIVTAKDLTTEDRHKLSGTVSSIIKKSGTDRQTLLLEIKKIISELESGTDIKPLNITGDKKILLVEDNEIVHIQIKTMLESNNYIVDIVENGQKAMEYVEYTIPDGIILDLMMPGVDGFEVLEKIRSTEITSKIPVLILTAKDLTSEDLNRLSANNIQQLIHKGDVDRENLLFKIKLMLGSQPGSGIKKKIPLPKVTKKADAKIIITGTPTILAVEDNPDNLTTLKAVLGNKYNMLEAIDGEAGLKMALTENPDLVLLDMSLPKLDGFTIVKKIKEDSNTRNLPVIALTARTMKGDKEKMLEAGCDDYISKPINPDMLLKTIENWLDIKE
ncbi:MAG: response regulator [Bacteroidetes bacterium]|nr:response regulator [Bacteroidota bacterium]